MNKISALSSPSRSGTFVSMNDQGAPVLDRANAGDDVENQRAVK